jgi:DNA-binding NarL/FixJ family response regulator
MAKTVINTADITTPERFEQAVADVLTGKATVASQPEQQVPVDPNSAHAKRNAARKARTVPTLAEYEAAPKFTTAQTAALQVVDAGSAVIGKRTDPKVGTVSASVASALVKMGVLVKVVGDASTRGTLVVRPKAEGEASKPAKAPKAAKAPVERRPVIQEDGKFYRIRANGTRRAVPILEGTALEQARVIRTSRDGANGKTPLTVREIADSLHMSNSTVRRLLASLELTEQHLAQQAPKPATRKRTKAS